MTSATEDIRVRRVIRMIEDRVADPLSIAELARCSPNLSPGHLRRLFHSVVGCSPAHYAKQHRLRHAFELLQSSFLSIKEIMAAAGWNESQSLLSRVQAPVRRQPAFVAHRTPTGGKRGPDERNRKHQLAKPPRDARSGSHVPRTARHLSPYRGQELTDTKEKS